MSIGKRGIQNLAFVEEPSDCSIEPISNGPSPCENNVSASNAAPPLAPLNIQTDDEGGSRLYKGKDLTARGYILIIALAGTICAGTASYSLIAPFFPRVAEAKGLAISQYTLVFTVYEVISFLLPPVISKFAIRMTPKVMLMTALIICSICCTTFGFMVFAKPGTTFFVLCLVVRVFWAVGSCGSSTTAYLCGTLLFPNHVSTIFAAIEIGAGLGFMAGPSIGGWLYELGGFTLPFLVTSLLCLLSIIPIFFLVQNEIKPKDKNTNESATTLLQAFAVPGVTINLALSSFTCILVGFNVSTLDFHLRQVGNFSPSQVGNVFLMAGLLYSFVTWATGYVTKKWSNAYYLIYLGLVMFAGSFIVFGPLPFLPWEPSIFLVISGQVYFEIGMGTLFVLCFDDGVKESKKHLPNNESTMATISGLFTSSYALGASMGPLIAGQLIDRFGFRMATVPMVIILIIVIVLVTFYIFRIRNRTKCASTAVA